jgi:hypothetical protein
MARLPDPDLPPFPNLREWPTSEQALANLAHMEGVIRQRLMRGPDDAPELPEPIRRDIAAHREMLVLIANLRANIEANLPGTVFH